MVRWPINSFTCFSVMPEKNSLGDITVFKGGTSLSKAYGCIERFSEDVDLAVIIDEELSNNQIKKLLKQITSTASRDLQEESTGGSKGSMIRKSYYSCPVTSFHLC